MDFFVLKWNLFDLKKTFSCIQIWSGFLNYGVQRKAYRLHVAAISHELPLQSFIQMIYTEH